MLCLDYSIYGSVVYSEDKRWEMHRNESGSKQALCHIYPAVWCAPVFCDSISVESVMQTKGVLMLTGRV